MITCQFENGKKADNLRHVTADAIIVKDKEILLTTRSAKVSNTGKLCLPGGFLDRDESVYEGVLREVKEETGYRAEVKKFLFVNDCPDRGDDRQIISFVFEIELKEKISEPDQEVTNLEWYALDALPPKDKFAFDHYRIIEAYKNYLKENHKLPKFISN